ncbi:MAG: DUF1801 domain-containing protein [Gemmataceae bacterium]
MKEPKPKPTREAKTKPTTASVEAYLEAIESAERRSDCAKLVQLLTKVTGHPPRMWGPSIVGFDSYRYTYASGHSGESCLVGFSSRKTDLTLYLLAGYESELVQEMLSRLGKHKLGKACLYLKKLADVDIAVLEELARHSITATRQQFPEAARS